MSKLELIDVIDDENNVIGQMTKEQSYQRKIPHRVVHVMVIWEKKVFIPRRALSVGYLPGYYCSSAGGHVQAGETSEQGALRELREEIGLGGPIIFVKSFFFLHDFPVHTSLFVKHFGPGNDVIQINPLEVQSGNFYSSEELGRLDHERFHPQLARCLKEIEEYL